MKNYLLLTALFLIFGAAQCGNKNTYELGQPFRLQVGETKRCQCKGPDIQFTAIKEDSRCPEYTDCLWEGQAVIQFSLEGGQRQYIDLGLRDGHPEMASRKVGNFIYRLKGVSPAPRPGKALQPEEYIVEVVVEGI